MTAKPTKATSGGMHEAKLKVLLCLLKNRSTFSRWGFIIKNGLEREISRPFLISPLVIAKN